MYCRNCGEQYVSDAAVMCVKCGVQKGVGRNYCPNCGQPTTPESIVCLNCGISLSGNNRAAGGTGGKSKIVAGLLGLFLGGFGAHNFYLGYTKKALIQLLVSLVGGLITCGIATFGIGIWALIESIMILCGNINVDADGNPLE